jgi:hypothetical protein
MGSEIEDDVADTQADVERVLPDVDGDLFRRPLEQLHDEGRFERRFVLK